MQSIKLMVFLLISLCLSLLSQAGPRQGSRQGERHFTPRSRAWPSRRACAAHGLLQSCSLWRTWRLPDPKFLSKANVQNL